MPGDVTSASCTVSKMTSITPSPHDGTITFPEVLFLAAAGNFGPEQKVFPAHCAVENIISVSEGDEGGLSVRSGLGDVAAPSSIRLVPPWQYYFESGIREVQRKNYSEARELLLFSLGIENSAETLFQLALVEILQHDYSSAVDHLSEARELVPNVGVIAAHLGVVKYLQGRHVEAKIHLEEAVELDNTDEMAQFNLGQTLVALGRSDEALVVFLGLRKLNTLYPNLDAAISRAILKAHALVQENTDE